MKAPKGRPGGVEVSIRPLSKAQVQAKLKPKSAKAGDAFRKGLPGARKR